MKLLHILNDIQFSGAEVMLNIASTSFAKAGIESHALSTGKTIGDYAATLASNGYHTHHIRFRKSPAFFIRLFRFIKKNRFDIVHIHTERAHVFYSFIVWIAGVRRSVRTIHSNFSFTGLLRLRKIIERYLARRILRTIQVAIGPSVAENERKWFYNKTDTIPNWYDESRIFPAQSKQEKLEIRNRIGIPENVFTFVSVGGCSAVKRHDHIIEAAAMLANKGLDFRYIHVGDGELNKSETGMVESNGIRDKVVFAGQISNVRDCLVASDVFVMTSQYEGFPISCLEAVVCGLPCIVYKVVGLIDLVKDGYNGILVEQNPSALAERLLFASGNATVLEEFSKNAISISKKFKAENSIKKMIEIYSS